MIKCDLATNSRNFEKLVQQPFLTCDGDYARGNWFNKKEEYLWVVRWRQIWWVLIRIGDKIRLITVLEPSLYKTQITMNNAMDRKQWKVDLLCNIICWWCFQDFFGHNDNSLPSIMTFHLNGHWTASRCNLSNTSCLTLSQCLLTLFKWAVGKGYYPGMPRQEMHFKVWKFLGQSSLSWVQGSRSSY